MIRSAISLQGGVGVVEGAEEGGGIIDWNTTGPLKQLASQKRFLHSNLQSLQGQMAVS